MVILYAILFDAYALFRLFSICATYCTLSCQIKPYAEFLKSSNGRSRLTSGNAAKVPMRLITELAGIAETGNGKR